MADVLKERGSTQDISSNPSEVEGIEQFVALGLRRTSSGLDSIDALPHSFSVATLKPFLRKQNRNEPRVFWQSEPTTVSGLGSHTDNGTERGV